VADVNFWQNVLVALIVTLLASRSVGWRFGRTG
jgi:hypothetical protein